MAAPPVDTAEMLGNMALPVPEAASTALDHQALPEDRRHRTFLDLLQDPASLRRPIESYEMSLVRQLVDVDESSWEPIRDYSWGHGETVSISQHKDRGLFDGAFFGRCRAVLPAATLESVLYSTSNFQERVVWDKQVDNYELCRTGGSLGCDSLYFRVKMGPFLSDRDFVLFQSIVPHATGRGATVLLRQATDALHPRSSRLVRGAMICSVLDVVARTDGGVALTLTTCVDMKLPISAWIINFFVPSTMKEWFYNLGVHVAKLGPAPPFAVKLPPAVPAAPTPLSSATTTEVAGPNPVAAQPPAACDAGAMEEVLPQLLMGGPGILLEADEAVAGEASCFSWPACQSCSPKL